ncbi:MAG TPA: 3-hydroxyisobutyrate dehydrogenase [Chloroflexota bacterium]
MTEQVGFIGIGNMGTPMAVNLARAGYAVLAYDILPRGIDQVVAAGGRAAASIAEVAGHGDVVISMLPSPTEVEAVVYGVDGLLDQMRSGQTLIDMSTIDPSVSRKVGMDLGARGVRMLDAPVSGSTEGAAAGTLTIMVGGPAELVERYRPLLGVMGKKIVHTGDLGSGETVKLCNNLMAGISMVAIAEAYALAERAGVDPKILFDVVRSSTGGGAVHDSRPVHAGLVPGAPVERDFEPGFMVDLIYKDLGLALATGRRYGVPLQMAATAQQIFGAASAMGYGRKDLSAVKFAIAAISTPVT